jgi:pyruvate-formate lyase-activating enzyme
MAKRKGGQKTPAEPSRAVFALEASMTGYTYADAFYPGSLAITVALAGCSARCSFCITLPGSWQPDRLEAAPAGLVTADGRVRTFRNLAAYLAPAQIVRGAVLAGAGVLAVTGGEPTYQASTFTATLCRMAKAAGLKTLLLSNGITDPAVVRQLAPNVDGVLLGIKGSLSPAFYERWMGVSGAVETVKQAARAWRDAGVWMQVTALLAPPSMQGDQEHESSEADLYGWILSDLGPHTPVSFGCMFRPGAAGEFFVSNPAEQDAYARRLHAAGPRARAMGLSYAADISRINDGHTVYRCHSCGGTVLLLQSPMIECGEACTVSASWCPRWSHEQHATAGRCDSCGAEVPVRTLPAAKIEANRRRVSALNQGRRGR